MAAEPKTETPELEAKLDKAMSDLMSNLFRSGTVVQPDNALKSSQAILNLAQAKQLLANGKK